MIFQESTSTRRIVGQLDDGDECVSALTDFCKEHDIQAANLRAIGRLDRAEVVRFDEETSEYEPIFEGDGTFDVVHLNGNISTLGSEVVARLETVLSTRGPAGPQLLAGQLRSGRVVELEFTLDVFDDLELERQLDRETGRLALKAIRRDEPEPEPSSEAETSSDSEPSTSSDEEERVEGKAMTWSDVASESDGDETGGASAKRRSRPDEANVSLSEPEPEPEIDEDDEDVDDIYGDIDLDAPLIEAGDVLDHPKLGRCRVIKVEDDEYVHVRTPNRGRMRKLSLNVVDVEFCGEENGRQIFEVEV
jgi:predicted DNA-binding protein with PD1-like motif